jgi:hypothetical protein
MYTGHIIECYVNADYETLEFLRDTGKEVGINCDGAVDQ